jgi:hypothetical protein
MGGVSKERRNQAQGYAFRSIDDVYNVLAPILGDVGLCILPRVTERVASDRISKRGDAMFHVTLRVEYDLVSALDGSKHTVVTYGEAMDTSDKATNKAMSAAYKYCCIQVFSIPTEGDNDPDAHSPVAVAKREDQARDVDTEAPTGSESSDDEAWRTKGDMIRAFQAMEPYIAPEVLASLKQKWGINDYSEFRDRLTATAAYREALRYARK